MTLSVHRLAVLILVSSLPLLVGGRYGAPPFTASHIATDQELVALIDELFFVAEGRIGDGSGAATFELDIGPGTHAPAQTAQFAWPNGTAVPFVLSFDGTMASFDIGGTTLDFVSVAPLTDLFLRTRAVRAASSASLVNLVLNGTALGETSNAEGDASGRDILHISGAALGSFTLSGEAILTWDGGNRPKNSQLAFQIKAGTAIASGEAPTVDIADPADGTLTNQTPIPVSGTVSGTEPVSVDVNGVAAAVSGNSYTANVPLAEGANTLTATASNGAGTDSASVSVTLDGTPPLVTITSPPDGSQTIGQQAVVTGTVVDASPIVDLQVNGVTAIVVGGDFTATVPLSLGGNPITAVAIDAAGNQGSNAVTTTRGTPPTVTITTPGDGSVVASSPTAVAGTVTGTAPLTVDVNGVPATVSEGAFEASVPLVAGSNTLSATAGNDFGQASDAVAVTLLSAPTLAVRIETPPDGATVSSRQIAVAGAVSDPQASVSVNGVAASVNGTGWTAAAVRIDEGVTALVATATRASETATDTSSVVLDLPPKIVITSPRDGAVVRSEATDVEGYVDDPTAFVDVNGVTASIGSAGRFVAVDVALQPGPNRLTARAVDPSGGTGRDEVEVNREDADAGRMRVVLVIERRFPLRPFGAPFQPAIPVIVEDGEEFAEALRDLGFAPELFDPAVEVPSFGFDAFELHLFVFTEAGVLGELVSVPALSNVFPSFTFETPLLPMGELDQEIIFVDLDPDTYRGEFLPKDFVPNGFARLTFFFEGGI